MDLRLYDTLTRSKRDFAPIDPENVRMYVCGPTVYDFAHIGNARPAIVFDVLYRLLRHQYGADHVTYVRNITDVDDKINDRALRDFPDMPLNEAIRKVTEKTEAQFHADVDALGCLRPTVEPRATDFVLPRPDGKADMVTIIQRLIDRNHAYVAGGEVLFDTQSMPDYGKLSGRRLNEQQAGARIAVDAHKKNPGDFVLWKGSSENEPGWDSPWVRGRPGWHIECSAMSAAYLGTTFDIHGGGLDLIFPHHENEIAQSRCAHGTSVMANYWMHNGFLQVEGEKMSKSTGNFLTIRGLLDEWPGDVLRLQMLTTHYRKPIDWAESRSLQATNELADWSRLIWNAQWLREEGRIDDLVSALADDLDTSSAVTVLRKMYSQAKNGNDQARADLSASCHFLGFKCLDQPGLFDLGAQCVGNVSSRKLFDSVPLVKQLRAALANDANEKKTAIISQLQDAHTRVEIEHGSIITLVEGDRDSNNRKIDKLISARIKARARKDFKESDRIRDELLAMGVVLKDGKDVDGKPITTWEIAR